MRVLIQRVKRASVKIDERVKSSIGVGLLVFAGIESADDETDVEWISKKITQLRIFDDKQKIPNLSVKEINGEILLVSQFTLHASTKKGNRPSYIKAARPEQSLPLYNLLTERLSNLLEKRVATGEFGAEMMVELINDGPLTIWMDSKEKE